MKASMSLEKEFRLATEDANMRSEADRLQAEQTLRAEMQHRARKGQ